MRSAERGPAVSVELAAVELRTHPRTQALPGTVHPADRAVVAAKLMANVASADFNIGEAVTAGDVLVVLSADEIAAQVEQARASLAQVERNYEREKRLLEQSASTPETVRTLEDQLRIARSRLSEAQTMDNYRSIRAPFDGVVVSKQVRRGDLASPGVPLFEIEGKGTLEVHVQVPDSLSALELGAGVDVAIDGKLVQATLSEWSPAADPVSRTRLAKLALPEAPTARSGQYVQVIWPASPTRSLVAPVSSVQSFGQIERVFVLENGSLRMRLVRTGQRSGEWMQIRSGLREGDLVVESPAADLRDGQAATPAS